MASAEQVASEPALRDVRRWAITAIVMLVSVLQILDIFFMHRMHAERAGAGEPVDERAVATAAAE